VHDGDPKFWMSDDFDDELPDEFWFGSGDELSDVNEKKR
jgi:hypothetical protein